jgi:hypothetical protein
VRMEKRRRIGWTLRGAEGVSVMRAAFREYG